ncbi:hypothetical protein [Microcella alkaliphila]|jgi:divalent metal cation (Fe/Co/Zn/Cd) transporter|uniref:Cation transporter n=1 Tax=Microcella alkaliphila TaxID=279828 RepID=A0A0U5BAN6_9MICO|nr:hypothetical protein [Microcella alkaliphila]BAU31311.1 cation transporter [Microcella alkaliphila]
MTDHDGRETTTETTTAATGSSARPVDPDQAMAIREVLVGTAGVQSVGEVVVHRLEKGDVLVTATLGFGRRTPVADVVAVLGEVKAGIRAALPDARTIVLEPEVAAPRADVDPPTDTIIIRGAD